MRIGYIGNLRPSFSTENHLYKTFRAIGHQVIQYQEDMCFAPNLMQSIVNDRCDLVIYTRTWGVNGMQPDFFKVLHERHGIPSASYHLDLYVGLQRQQGIRNDPFWHTTYCFTVDGDEKSQDYFKECGINHIWLRAGVFKPECYLATPDRVRYPEPIIFVGSYNYHPEWPWRKQLVDWLQDTYGAEFGKHGSPEDTVREHDLNVLYASAKIVVGDSLTPGYVHRNYTSDRIYETTGRGGFLIHPWVNSIEDEFKDGQDLRTFKFGDFKGLQRIIDYYLLPSNEPERLRIRDSGFTKTRTEYNYEVRMRWLLDYIAAREPNVAANY